MIQPAASLGILAQAVKADQDSQNDDEQYPPIRFEKVTGADENLGGQGQILAHILENRSDIGNYVNKKKTEDQDPDEHDQQRVNHGRHHAAFQFLLLFHDFGQPVQDEFQGAGALSDPDHVDINS